MRVPYRVRNCGQYDWVDRGSETDDRLTFTGHEKPLEPIIRGLMPPGTAFVDVGAHTGLWTVRLSDKYSVAYSFEANRFTAVALKKNVELNGLTDRVMLYPNPVWDGDSEVFGLIDSHGMESGGSTRLATSASADRKKLTNPSWRLDTVMEVDAFAAVGLIKIDVEGAERRVLEGARGLIERDQPNLFVELHDGLPGAPEGVGDSVRAFLEEMEYHYNDRIHYGGGTYIAAQPVRNVFASPGA
jgi:FkbM family methyltransferase